MYLQVIKIRNIYTHIEKYHYYFSPNHIISSCYICHCEQSAVLAAGCWGVTPVTDGRHQKQNITGHIGHTVYQGAGGYIGSNQLQFITISASNIYCKKKTDSIELCENLSDYFVWIFHEYLYQIDCSFTFINVTGKNF